MVKKKLLIITMILALGLLIACGDDAAPRTATSANMTVADIMNAASASTSAAEEESATSTEEVSGTEEATGTETQEELPVISTKASDVDIDLTAMSKTMVYSEVYNIMVSPEDYVGKTIRMEGIYNTFVDPNTDIQYFYCIIQDATACCAQGLEFELTDDYRYPDDYPASGEITTVVGRFDTYMEDEYLYCTLRDAVLENN